MFVHDVYYRMEREKKEGEFQNRLSFTFADVSRERYLETVQVVGRREQEHYILKWRAFFSLFILLFPLEQPRLL